MSGHHDLPSLIDGFHSAALDPDRWHDALFRLGQAVGGSGVVVLTAYDPCGGAQLFESVGYDTEHWGRVQAEHSRPETNRYIGLLNAAGPGQVLQPRALMSLSDWLEDPIYRRFLRPDGLQDGLTAPLYHKDGGFAAIATFRSRHYDSYHLKSLHAALPHVRHALDVHLRLNTHRNLARTGFGALDQLRIGVLLCDSHARMIYTNAAAQSLLHGTGGLDVGKAGMLSAEKPSETVRLRRLIKTAGDTASRSARNTRLQHGTEAAGGAMQVSRRSAPAPIHLLITPLRPTEMLGARTLGASASVMIFVSDPNPGVGVTAEAVRQLYGLTHAEARLAVHLVSGRDLAAAATAMGISPNTARTLLKRGFERTGTNRQADLVSLILRGPLAAVARDPRR